MSENRTSADIELSPVDYDPFAGESLAHVVPTTEAQREIWLADQLGREASLAYNESTSLHIAGAVDLDALQQAVHALAERHEMLRATLSADGMNLMIGVQATLQAKILDLTPYAEAERVAGLARLHADVVETPFDLVNGPLFRVFAVILGANRFEVILTGHHITCDGWSFGVLAPELMKLYAGYAVGQPVQLPPADCFSEYALGQIDTEHLAATEADNRYWVSLFDQSMPVLDLPADRPRPAHRTFSSQREDMMLSADEVSAIRQCGARHGASLFATMFAMFAGLMARLSGSDEVVVGVPAAGQSAAGKDTLVGHCVNLLPVRLPVQADAAIADLLRNARGRILDAYDHQSSTFGGILAKLQAARDPSRLPLVSVLFNIDAAIDPNDLSLACLEVELRSNPRHFENFELFLNAFQIGREIRLELQYNTDLFDLATVRRWLELYRTALQRVASNPALTLAAAYTPSEADLAQLSTWNATRRSSAAGASISDLFGRQVATTPERTALSFGESKLSYAQLDQRANRLANLLRSRGIGRGQLVGLCVERSLAMVVAQLAVLKSGAAYVPLDPSYPAERLHYMAEDAHLAALVSESALAGLLSWPREQTILLDTDAGLIEAQPITPPAKGALDATPDDAAYVIYTSGSTGKPKGVQVHHRAVVNFLASMQREPGISADDRLVAVTTLSFDIAVLELLLPLTVGAEVVLASRDQAVDPHALADLLARSRATIMQATPGTWRMLLDSGWQAAPGFKALIGGEALSPDLATRLLAVVGALWNMYGPTETTVWSTCWRVTAPDSGISIGRPIANTTVWILDEHRQLCPIGTPGELWIGGDGVTLGYLNRPELTAERFIPDPFSTTPGARLYGTGDRARWRSDGLLEHLGRNDFQVKVRGFRIELGEIEAALDSHPAIAHSVVIAREDVPGDVRLVAYFVPRGTPPDTNALRDHLRTSLPAYMLPQHFMPLDQLPLLPNGKINRKALPAPETGRAESRIERVAPRTPLEAQLLEIMEQVLNLPGLGIHDNFFSLGGHSLLASQLAARIGRALKTQVPLRTIFDTPTAEGLAQWIEASSRLLGATQWNIPRRSDRATAPLSLMQQRIWFLEQMYPGRPTYNTPSAHRLRGKLDETAFNRAFAEVVHRQDALRTLIAEADGSPMQVILPDLSVNLLPVEDLRGSPDQDRVLHETLADLAAQVLDLGEAPLFRARLFRTHDEEYVFYFSPHHIIWDGWSFDILYREMSALYEAFRTDTPCQLPPPTIAYGDFALWHRDWLQGDELRSQVDHWKNCLSGVLEPLNTPTDRPRPAMMSGDGFTQWIEFEPAVANAARDLARSVDATPFMSLLAAYALTLHKLTGQSQVIVGVPVRGRQIEQLEMVMGMFVNALPLRLTVDPGTSFLQLLRGVRDSVVDAFKFPDVPFEHLVRELKVPHDLSRSPIYQALFSFQDARDREPHWGNLMHDMIHVLQPSAAEDISLWLMERPNGLVGGMIVNTDIMSAESASLLKQRFNHLLRTALAEPNLPIFELPLPEEEGRLLKQWNATVSGYPREDQIFDLIACQVATTPERTAISFGESKLSYAQLDQRANRLANLLRSRGIGRGQLVGLCVERSLAMVVAQLAVLKSGAAYVPLDPSYPAERLHYMAEDAHLAALVSESALAGLLSWPREQTILLDTDAGLIEAQPITPPAKGALDATPDDAAYVIYTSGSTGKPKGVQVHHRAVVNFLASMQREPGISADDRLVAVTTLSFDIAVLELLLPLTVGAEVVLASRDQAVDPHALADLLARSRATIMQATPGTWRMLLDSGWQAAPGFKALIGGEALSPDLATRLLAVVGALWNMYGPTETTVWSTCWRVTAPDSGISIGRPIANTTVWILDEHRQLCPIGTPGELWIGGDGVTLGYLNRPELTAERFIPDPFSTTPGARLYGTGDRARWRSDGLLEHLGRNDFQVKVRGFRIELGEIEAALDSHPAIAHSVVIAREDVPGDVRLVAYFVPQGTAPEPSTLREHLRSSLPAYMLPQHFMPLDQLPLLPNGKIDRKGLPVPGADSAVSRKRVEAPQSDTEAHLAAVWAEMLKIPDVSLHDNFFDLGGHSLLAMQVILAMEARVGKRINPRHMIFETLRQVAKAYDDAPKTEQKKSVLSSLLGNLLGTRK